MHVHASQVVNLYYWTSIMAINTHILIKFCYRVLFTFVDNIKLRINNRLSIEIHMLMLHHEANVYYMYTI